MGQWFVNKCRLHIERVASREKIFASNHLWLPYPTIFVCCPIRLSAGQPAQDIQIPPRARAASYFQQQRFVPWDSCGREQLMPQLLRYMGIFLPKFDRISGLSVPRILLPFNALYSTSSLHRHPQNFTKQSNR